MSLGYTLVALMCILVHVLGMPYYVPLQGSVGGKRTLVLLDSLVSKGLYSMFFDNLQKSGYTLTYLTATSPSWKLKSYDEYLYDNIVIFAPQVEDFGSTHFSDILEFVNAGGNILMAGNGETSSAQRAFAESCGVRFDTEGASILDHFSSNDELDFERTHTAVALKSVIKSEPIVGGELASSSDVSILYRGTTLRIADSNELIVQVLHGNPSSASTAGSAENSGSSLLLVAAIQARNNARVLVSGSVDMFSNAFFSKQSDNAAFCDRISKWAFGDSGVLRFRDIEHFKSDGTPPDVILHEKERPDLPESLYPDPEITRNSLVYRIKDEIIYTMIVEELKDGEWVPFIADDMQMEFVMLDPYVRTTMKVNKVTGKFTAIFDAPDAYGIFKFRVLYRRPGFSVLHAETKVSLRPFKHDEYERFIPTAYPYYTSALTMGVAFLIFSILFIMSEDEKPKND